MAAVPSNSNYTGGISDCEPFKVSPAQLGISTEVHKDGTHTALVGNIPLNGGAHDSATVTGKVNSFALPNVTFYFFDNGVTCKNGDTTGGTALNSLAPDATGVAHPSTSETNLAAGTYNFMAAVPSNSNYTGAISDCEPFTVSKADTTLTTEVHDPNHTDVTNKIVAFGTAVHDKAFVGGFVTGFPIDGTVTFKLYRGACTTGTLLTSQDKSVSGSADPLTVESSDSSSSLTPGSYCYKATFTDKSGNYSDATAANEPFSIIQKSVVTDTQLCTFDLDSGTAGSQFRLLYTPDSGGYWKLNATNPGQFYYNVFDNNPTGKIQFTLPYPWVTQGAQPIHAYG